LWKFHYGFEKISIGRFFTAAKGKESAKRQRNSLCILWYHSVFLALLKLMALKKIETSNDWPGNVE